MLLSARQGGEEKGVKFTLDISDANDHLQTDQSCSVSHEAGVCFITCHERFRQFFANGRSYN